MRTSVTELFGIEYPIFQGGMAWVSDWELVAAVSEAGGFGILGASAYDPDKLRDAIRKIRENTDKPFGVNTIAHSEELIPLLEVVGDEKVCLATYGTGNPKKIIDYLKPRGVMSFPVVPSVVLAERAASDGADGVIVEGMESGGHVGKLTTMVLIPLVADRVKIPIVAAGGIADKRGMAAALALGADGIQMGTRFIASKESPVPENIKQRLVKSNAEDTVITGNITGLPVRVIKNQLAKDMLKMEKSKKPLDEMIQFGSGKMQQAFVDGDEVMGSIMAGQITGMVDDIPSVREIMQRMVDGLPEVVNAVKEKL